MIVLIDYYSQKIGGDNSNYCHKNVGGNILTTDDSCYSQKMMGSNKKQLTMDSFMATARSKEMFICIM